MRFASVFKSPDEIEEGIRRSHDGPAGSCVSLFLGAITGVYDENQHNPHDDRNEGGPQVVCDGEKAHTPTGLGVHGCQARHKTVHRAIREKSQGYILHALTRQWNSFHKILSLCIFSFVKFMFNSWHGMFSGVAGL